MRCECGAILRQDPDGSGSLYCESAEFCEWCRQQCHDWVRVDFDDSIPQDKKFRLICTRCLSETLCCLCKRQSPDSDSAIERECWGVTGKRRDKLICGACWEARLERDHKRWLRRKEAGLA